MRDIIEVAKNIATQAHADVNHLYDHFPYEVHLGYVVTTAQRYGYLLPNRDYDKVIAACWLHDTLEDTRLTYNDICSAFGDQFDSNLIHEVAEIVFALTNNKGRNRKERANAAYYEGIRKTPFATFVKLCDRIANVSYSKMFGSKMLSMYRRENADFLASLCPEAGWQPMVDELDILLAQDIETEGQS